MADNHVSDQLWQEFRAGRSVGHRVRHRLTAIGQPPLQPVG